MTREALRATVPQVPEDAFNQIFNAIDKNRDDQVCVKQQPTFTNAVDNTSNARDHHATGLRIAADASRVHELGVTGGYGARFRLRSGIGPCFFQRPAASR
ncbi:MAG: hypothetical protein M3415_04110 [Actinomycetota bacterium]|jgi:hypothetical protein|nr:hypothetical protein [Actinomycetota bacterium]